MEVLIEGISAIVLSFTIYNGPRTLLKLQWLHVREPLLLVLLPVPLVSFRVKYLAMKKLLGLDVSKVAVNLELPVVQEVILLEMLHQVVDSVESLIRLSDHVGSQITHFFAILGEIRGQASLLAKRGH